MFFDNIKNYCIEFTPGNNNKIIYAAKLKNYQN